MITARDLIKGSLRLIGVLASGETPSASEQADALLVLNEMLDSWSTERLIINAPTIDTLPLVSGKQDYTFGAGGDFDVARPVKVLKVGIKIENTLPAIEIPIDLLNMDQWSRILVKSTTSTFPTKIYFEETAPLTIAHVWPIPTTVNSLVIYSIKPLLKIPSADTVIDLPPGYQKALRYSLAVELFPEYGKPVDELILAQATKALEGIKRVNSKPIYMDTDFGTSGGKKVFNWYTGE